MTYKTCLSCGKPTVPNYDCIYCEGYPAARTLIRRRWVAILESTHLSQAFGKMSDGVAKYCPVGLAVRELLEIWPDVPMLVTKRHKELMKPNAGLADYEFEALGLDILLTAADAEYLSKHAFELGTLSTANRGNVVTKMNDTMKWSFKQIAKALQELGWDR